MHGQEPTEKSKLSRVNMNFVRCSPLNKYNIKLEYAICTMSVLRFSGEITVINVLNLKKKKQ